jgi:hypothetical protein
VANMSLFPFVRCRNLRLLILNGSIFSALIFWAYWSPISYIHVRKAFALINYETICIIHQVPLFLEKNNCVYRSGQCLDITCCRLTLKTALNSYKRSFLYKTIWTNYNWSAIHSVILDLVITLDFSFGMTVCCSSFHAYEMHSTYIKRD